MEVDEDMQKQIICPMCMQILKKPKLLTCMHTFCESCIKPLIAYDSGEMICPVCRHVTMTYDGTSSLSSNFIAQNIIEAFEAMSLRSEGVLRCSECEQDIANMFCCDCYQRLCSICTEHHKRSLKFKGHNILLFEDVSRDDMLQGKLKQCENHNEVLKYYCNNCSHTICHDCSVSKKHIGHNYELLDELVTDNKDNLKKLMEKATKKKKAMNKSIIEAENILVNLEEVKDYSITLIEETFGKLNDLLIAKKILLIRTVKSKFEGGRKSVEKARENSRILDEWVSFTNTIIESRCNAEIMDVFVNLKRQLEEISVMSFMKPKSIQEMEEASQKIIPQVCMNPNAKSKPRVSSVSQILGIENMSSTIRRKPFSSHSSDTSSMSGSQISLTEVDASHIHSTNTVNEIRDTDNHGEAETVIIQNDHTQYNSPERNLKKIIPNEMTPDINVSKQVKYEEWDFHKTNSNISVKSSKRKPPPRPPPALIHQQRQQTISTTPPSTQPRNLKKRRQTIANKPTSPPPAPPSTKHPFTRSMTQPEIGHKENVKTRRASLKARKAPSLPPQIPAPPKSPTLLTQASNLETTEFPIRPSSSNHTESDQNEQYMGYDREKYLEHNTDHDSIPEDEDSESTNAETNINIRNIPCAQNTADENERQVCKQEKESLAKPPQAPPRFFAGITMMREEVIVNKDVLKLIMEAINDACLVSSDQDSEVAQSDTMFTIKEELFNQ